MDILPLPHDYDASTVEVPYLCGRQGHHARTYDYGDWRNFPIRCGRSEDDLYADAKDDQYQKLEKQSLLQAWLFFGLLMEFLGRRDDQEAFVEPRGGREVVSWDRIQQRLRQWTRKVQSSIHSENLRLKQRLDVLSNDAGHVINSFCRSDLDRSPLNDDVTLSILLLASLLELAKASVPHHLPNPLRIPALAPPFLQSAMTRQNWCPSDVFRMRNTLGSLCATYFLSLMGPPDPTLRHDRCDDRRCKAFQVTEQYQHRHIAGCSCHNMMSVDADQTSQLILSDCTPLALARTPPFGRSRLETIALDPTRPLPFVAVSHVWSQGLGNPSGNSLPRCQVESIQRWCNEVLGKQDVSFWMDTFGIPRIDPAKIRAIESMSAIYAAAEAVLVIDTALLDLPTHVSDMELVAHMYACGWLRRVWTLQEGVKARRLYFRLRDGYLNVATLAQRISDRLRGDVDFDPSNILAWEFLRPLITFEGITADDLGAALSSLRFRDTTNAGDDLLCVKGILGWHEEAVRSRRDDTASPANFSELQRLLLRRSQLPAEILFSSGQRMEAPGWTWAPSSADQIAFQIEGAQTSKATVEGLRGCYYGIEISKVPAGTLNSSFALHESMAGLWLAVQDTSDVDIGRTSMSNLHRSSVVARPSWIDGLGRPAILMQHRLPRVGGTNSTVGVLVDVQHEREGVKYARYCGSVALIMQLTEMVQLFEQQVRSLGSRESMATTWAEMVRLGSAVVGIQQWCIS